MSTLYEYLNGLQGLEGRVSWDSVPVKASSYAVLKETVADVGLIAHVEVFWAAPQGVNLATERLKVAALLEAIRAAVGMVDQDATEEYLIGLAHLETEPPQFDPTSGGGYRAEVRFLVLEYPHLLLIPTYAPGALLTDALTGNRLPPAGPSVAVRVHLMQEGEVQVRALLGADEHDATLRVRWHPINPIPFEAIVYGTQIPLEWGGRRGTLTLIGPHPQSSSDPQRGRGLQVLAAWTTPQRS